MLLNIESQKHINHPGKTKHTHLDRIGGFNHPGKTTSRCGRRWFLFGLLFGVAGHEFASSRRRRRVELVATVDASASVEMELERRLGRREVELVATVDGTEKTQAKKKRRRKESLVPLRSEKGFASEKKGFGDLDGGRLRLPPAALSPAMGLQAADGLKVRRDRSRPVSIAAPTPIAAMERVCSISLVSFTVSRWVLR
ncbi:hypothetical protein LXL04_022910 [Taraxacum kok-saghyz]